MAATGQFSCPPAGSFVAVSGQFLVAAVTSIPFNYADGTPRERIEEDWAMRLPLACTPAGYLAQAQGTASWSGLERLPTVHVPTLVLHGEDDRLVPAENGRRIAANVPGAEL